MITSDKGKVVIKGEAAVLMADVEIAFKAVHEALVKDVDKDIADTLMAFLLERVVESLNLGGSDEENEKS